MSKPPSTVWRPGSLSPIAIQNCTGSLYWSFWTLGNAIEALRRPVAAIAAEIRDDPALARQMRELYKMMSIERAGADLRDRFAAVLLDRLREVFAAAGPAVGEVDITVPIDFAYVPLSRGVDAELINGMRPTTPFQS